MLKYLNVLNKCTTLLNFYILIRQFGVVRKNLENLIGNDFLLVALKSKSVRYKYNTLRENYKNGGLHFYPKFKKNVFFRRIY